MPDYGEEVHDGQQYQQQEVIEEDPIQDKI
jgi:calpain